ncbi:hypothetical protein L226DRAFT_58766 [Lentinus tigrinus ALCF2SS1-7]|uniref:Uncharacterized protein n=1 Tax=Lentinus tigrinus ALCF2SS1-6 TaxID=1328759 RepID=A0A5C2SD26_9APHY|nr:hypothetical protein L227DRAFT_78512 [Lentinus tigrinus ALCF2SS1-6]RPD75249.1 hypothetical protein L226DRAFT_58766 [Lentinus tigrinus ALCF2SS1-7]
MYGPSPSLRETVDTMSPQIRPRTCSKSSFTPSHAAQVTACDAEFMKTALHKNVLLLLVYHISNAVRSVSKIRDRNARSLEIIQPLRTSGSKSRSTSSGTRNYSDRHLPEPPALTWNVDSCAKSADVPCSVSGGWGNHDVRAGEASARTGQPE